MTPNAHTLDLIHKTLSNFSAGLEAPVLAFHLKSLVPLHSLTPLLEELEKQGRVTRHRYNHNTPAIWKAIAPTTTETQP